ncbi:MAG: sigma 54-interacting transcriptional regulator [Deltaproteobacteria bacterium]|nr:sigma 54-interacting transcriptional regulator [Deltaproteobacteria bacterium]
MSHDPSVEELVTERAESVEDEPSAAAQGTRVFLVVTDGADAGRAYELPEGKEITIGRTKDATIFVDDPRVSRKHARISRLGALLLAEDLGSRNGIRVNNDVVAGAQRLLHAGDLIRVGSAQLSLAIVAAAGAPQKALAKTPGPLAPPEGLIVADPDMRRVFQIVQRLGRTNTTVLILGETGVGKEVVAEQIHRASVASGGPFVRLNCASLPESLLEAELFGHERGAFTGADQRKVGYIEAANGGTLFLDEVAEMSRTTQAKLLLTLENRTIVRLGATKELPVSVRFVSATNRDLRKDVEQGRFREDLYYRLSAFTLQIPPLRKRPTEIALLADLFIRDFAARMSEPPARLTPAAVAALRQYAWPGNVRELRNAMEHALVLAEDGVIDVPHLPIRDNTSMAAPAASLRDDVEDAEKRSIVEALAACEGHRARAAQLLGISRRALMYKLAKYGLSKGNG